MQSAPAPVANAPVSVIVPTLNEAGNIDVLIDAVLGGGASLDVEIIVVDDGSTDGTRELVRAREANAPVRLLCRDAQDGLAGAVLAGARLANHEIVVVMDADLSHPPERIPDLIAPIRDGRSDLVIGSRYAPGGSTPGWPWRRRIASRAAAALAWPLTEVRDSLSGFFATRRELLLAVGSEVAGFKIALEILVRGGETLRVQELPIVFRDRARGESKMGPDIVVTYLRRLAAMSGARWSARHSRRLRLFDGLEFLTDFLVFLALITAGLAPGVSHLASFAVASCLSYALKAPIAFQGTDGRPGFDFHLRFLFVRLMAVFLRGGALALGVQQWGWPAIAAILPAIAVSAVVDYAGNIFLISSAVRRFGPGIWWRLAAIGVVGYLTALRLVYLGLPNLMPEEAYYWNYGQHLAPGYLDHPPMVAWLTRLGTSMLGHDEFGVRLGAFISWLVASVFVFRLTRDVHGKTTAFVAVLLLQTLPFFFSAGIILTPDAPLVACWAGMLYFLYRALVAGENRAWWGMGVCLGLGMLSKYSITTLGIATLVFMLADRDARRWFWNPRPYLAVLLAAAIFSPVIYWNATHQWASFAFQSSRRLGVAPEFSLHLLVGSILFLLTPTGAAAALFALSRRGADRSTFFAKIFTLVPLGVFAFFSLRHRVQLNWTGPLWLALLPGIAHGIVTLRTDSTGRFAAAVRGSWRPTIAAIVILAGAGLHYLTLGLPGIRYGKRMELVPVGWEDLGQQVSAISRQVTRETGSEPLLVGMDRYFTSSELAFYAGDGRSAAAHTAGRNLFGGISLMYDWWFPRNEQVGKDLVLVAFEKADLERDTIRHRLTHADSIKRGDVMRNGRVIRHFYWRVGHDYRGHLNRIAN
jgi:dolichol-phosphate mannosyltransferase